MTFNGLVDVIHMDTKRRSQFRKTTTDETEEQLTKQLNEEITEEPDIQIVNVDQVSGNESLQRFDLNKPILKNEEGFYNIIYMGKTPLKMLQVGDSLLIIDPSQVPRPGEIPVEALMSASGDSPN